MLMLPTVPDGGKTFQGLPYLPNVVTPLLEYVARRNLYHWFPISLVQVWSIFASDELY